MNQHVQNQVTRKIVLTGGPGVGKTSILRRLQDLGYEVREEVFTKIFAAAQKAEKFNDEFLNSKELIRDLISAQNELENQPILDTLVFLDRSRVDILGYTKNIGSTLLEKDRKWLETNEYSLVFMIEPLPAKYYDQNQIRRQTQQDSLIHHRAMIQNYIDFFKVNNMNIDKLLIHVPFFEVEPKQSILLRTQFILDKLNAQY